MGQYNYRTEIERFAEKHYINKFQKEYKDKWPATERTLIAVCERIDNILRHSRADLISAAGGYK
jgi:hypothetical protein